MIADISNLLKFLQKELPKFCDLAVLGMSGGADSTLVATLCQQILGASKVYTLHMPACTYDEENFNDSSLKTAKFLKVSAVRFPIGGLATSFGEHFVTATNCNLGQVNAGNVRARLRMMVLYSYAHHLSTKTQKRVRVIGTGNLSEDYIGYDTKGGDALADLFLIGELFKSEVYQLLDYFCELGVIEKNMINRIPSAGLWAGQTDEDELGFSYNTMEKAVRDDMKNIKPSKDNDAHLFVHNRHKMHSHKHEAPMVTPLRNFCK